MVDANAVRMLRELLGLHLSWHGARLDFLARCMLALLQVRTVNLGRLAPVLSDRAKTSSNYIRLQRFFREFALDHGELAEFIGWLLPTEKPWVLTLDRTNWRLGRTEINLLVLGVSYGGIAIPIAWTALEHGGNSSTQERLALLARWRARFPAQEVAYLLADREFIGRDWIAGLRQLHIPFRLRLRADTQVIEGHRSRRLDAYCASLKPGHSRVLRCARLIWGDQHVYLSAKRLDSGEWLFVASDTYAHGALREYAQRWEIESLFAALKSHGFHLEETHLTQPERLERLFALLALTTLWAVHAGLWVHQQQPVRQKKHSTARISASCASDSISSSA